jgi:hypothetical protein
VGPFSTTITKTAAPEGTADVDGLSSTDEMSCANDGGDESANLLWTGEAEVDMATTVVKAG